MKKEKIKQKKGEISMLSGKTEPAKSLILNKEIEGTEETHEYLSENRVCVRSKIHRYPSTSLFLTDYWIPTLIQTECEWEWSSLEEVIEEPTLEKVLQFPIETWMRKIEEQDLDELDALVHFLQIHSTLQQESSLTVIVIDSIEAFEEGTGLGTQLVNQYKDEVDLIVLYSLQEAESYLVKQGFKEFFNGHFVWSANPKWICLFQEGIV